MFGTAQTATVGIGPHHTASADFNGDGFGDIAVTNIGTGDVSDLLGQCR